MSKKKSGYFSGLLAGAMLGAAAYHYLTSTKEGKEIKEKLKKKTQETVDHLTETIGELEQKGEEFKNRTKKIQKDLEKRAKSASTEVAQEAKKKLKEIEDLKARGRSASRVFFTKNGRSLAKKKTSPKA